MLASDVYVIAKALQEEEFTKLFHMLKSEMNKKNINIKDKLPDFADNDAIRYLIENVVKKSRTNRTK
ncbi:hypothetical protein [Polaribacter dokdonensis]|uniref:Uncharacterized protein n=1 Tax=Polaribacter dokdonensis DSW-5 TaxID=1300348 RepID=A0A0M9CGT7_9FLAO|nr:hypothetical protein [Polaribacter dokdonensis]KOY52242.1 hypothetical protein I602_1802 [Polaribacter dokdonensis DSW-5]SEE41783.1 hypothetical protein SAMN05444353_1570 [Polaribacter dokdonensis DSW-5]